MKARLHAAKELFPYKSQEDIKSRSSALSADDHCVNVSMIFFQGLVDHIK